MNVGAHPMRGSGRHEGRIAPLIRIGCQDPRAEHRHRGDQQQKDNAAHPHSVAEEASQGQTPRTGRIRVHDRMRGSTHRNNKSDIKFKT